ncbi:MAG: alpha/beta hydrolase [Planctomycetota bacterium]
MKKSTSLLPCVVVEHGQPAAGAVPACVVWLHGLGADGHDFESIVPELRLPRALAVRFVFPHAPVRPVSLNGGMPMRAWYDIKSLDADRDEDAAGVQDSARLIEALVASEVARGCPPSRLVLAGFSQGGAMAAHVGLRAAERVAGVMILSGYLLLADSLEAEASPANRDVPILECHGTHDPVVPIAFAERGRRRLEELRYRVEWRTYPMQHNVCGEEIVDVARWLVRVLA